MSKRQSTQDRGSDQKRQKRIAVVQAFDPGEAMDVDVLRVPVTSSYYAFTEKLEIERTAGGGRLWHIDFHCISAAWFDLLADDLSNIPAVNTIAQVAESRLVEVSTTDAMIQAVQHVINVPHFHEGWWVTLHVSDQLVDQFDVPCVVFLPAAGSSDPATIGTTPNSELGFIRYIERVRPPATVGKLLRFSHNWNI